MTVMMKMISDFFSAQHRAGDKLFEEMEQAVSHGDWPQAESLCERFHDDIEQHLANEENVLFPLLEDATGMRPGPTQVMRGEHVEIRELLQRIGEAIKTGEKNESLGIAETLFLFLQQHNVKEEQVLYPMADQALEEKLPETSARIPGFTLEAVRE